MTPSLPIATDNIYKFTGLFGLALIITSLIAYFSTYHTFLEQKIKHHEMVIALEAKTPRSKTDDDLLALHKKLVDLANANQTGVAKIISVILSVGIALSVVGLWLWYTKIQVRDDKLAQLQIAKLECEVAKLQAERAASNPAGATGADPAAGVSPS